MSVKAKKHLGQHFLKDLSIAERIAETLPNKDLKVLEIGPGMGVLTQYLLAKNHDTTVVEIDNESVAYLHMHFNDKGLKIIEGDFLKMDLQTLFGNDQYAIIGNFPYNISTQIVFKAIEHRDNIPFFSGMFQKEVAERIAEKPGSKKYGILSVLAQAFFEIDYLFTVPPTVFDPPPKVNSGVIQLVRREDYSLPVPEKMFFRVIKTAFNQRRKMLRSSLKSLQLSDKLREDAIFAKRPEQLGVAEFIKLTQMIMADTKE